MVRLAAFLLLASITMQACNRSQEKVLVNQEPVLVLDPETRHQTIEGWGTSMISFDIPRTPYRDPAWRRAFRDLGLNILRINATKEVLVDPSGDMTIPVPLGPDLKSNIAKMDFENPKTKVYGDMAAWLSEHALEPERTKITASVWSPPHWMKGPTGTLQYHVTRPTVKRPTPWLSDGKRGDSIGGRLLQTPANREQFARYLAAWVEGFEQHYGVPLYALSIQNELSFENPFDSATYSEGPAGEKEQWWQYASALKAVKDEFTQQRIQTKIIGPHMSQVGVRPSDPWGLRHQMSYIDAVKAHRDPELLDFLFAYNSNGYLGTSEDAVKMWAAYYRGKHQVTGNWARWANAPGVARDGKPIWISEAGGADGTWLNGENGAVGHGAITVAQKVHNALVHGNAGAYVYWQLSGNKDEETAHSLLGKKHIPNPTQSKKYAAFKHFSRYVRPGAVRIGATFPNGLSSVGGASGYDTFNSLNASAFLHESDQTLTVVLVNMRASATPVAVQIPKELSITSPRLYITSNEQDFTRLGDLTVSGGKVSFTVPSHAVLTLHGRIAPTASQGRLPHEKLAVLRPRRR